MIKVINISLKKCVFVYIEIVKKIVHNKIGDD
jgi:hypothetical protein